MSKYYFDSEEAELAVDFIEQYTFHVKGELAGRNFKLEEWQKEEIIKPLFGWKRTVDNTRKYRTAFVALPRKNGKSSLCAGIGLYLLLCDHEYGAEIYNAAGDRGQAGIVHDIAKAMLNFSPALNKRLKVFRDSIVFSKRNSFYKAISSDSTTKHGFNASGIIFDELHTQPNRELWDVLTTSTGARTQPLNVVITTAGQDFNSICWEIWDYALKVKEGIIEDETFLPVIYAADEEDDIYSEETWKKANPGYGSIVKKEYFEQQINKIKNQPSYENTFKRLHLNIWTRAEKGWIPDQNIIKNNVEFDIELLEGSLCYAGLDLATRSDMTALVLDFPKTYGEVLELFKIKKKPFEIDENEIIHLIVPYLFVPLERAKQRQQSATNSPYLDWIERGYLIGTEGNVCDYNYIKQKIFEISERFDLDSIAYDRWNSSQLVIDLTEEGINMNPMGQGYASMSAPTKELEKLILENRIWYNENPVMRWMYSNVTLKEDPAGNIKLDKGKSSDKIDGPVAKVMALAEFMSFFTEAGSAYEDQGIFSI